MAIQPEIDTEVCHGCENGIRAGRLVNTDRITVEEIVVHYLSGKIHGPPSPCLNPSWETCEYCDCRTPPENMIRGQCDECYAENDYSSDAEYESDNMDGDRYGYDEMPYGDVPFADPGGNSALRAASASNPRNLPCPTCGDENVLTPADVARHYQCDRCSDKAEGKYFGGDY